MSKDKICWRGTDGDSSPVKCIVEGEFGYPHDCRIEATGKVETMYENTHFRDKKHAWASIVTSVKSSIPFFGRRVKEARERLREVEQEAATETERYESVKQNRDNPFRAEL